MIMPIEINQWRATIGCFCLSIQSLSPLGKAVKPLSILFQVLKLYWFCCSFITISILVLPLTLAIQPLALHSVATQLSSLPLFARMHCFAKVAIYTAVELLKRTPCGIIGLIRKKRSFVKHFLFMYAYFYIGCITCYTLHTQWLIFRTILLSGDVETNPGPETLDFCCWNLIALLCMTFYESLF